MAGWAVFHITVMDADQPQIPTSISYYLEEGNEAGIFRIDEDGTLRTTDKLNIGIRPGQVFSLKVRVSDGGDPPLQSRTWIHVKVSPKPHLI